MPQFTIVSHGDWAAVVLPAAFLETLGLRDGDVVEATLVDQQIILRPEEQALRQRQVREITREVFEQRLDAYQRLA